MSQDDGTIALPVDELSHGESRWLIPAQMQMGPGDVVATDGETVLMQLGMKVRLEVKL
jgi:hypothetical protein